ncbi:porin, partial [Roseibium hamelinense]
VYLDSRTNTEFGLLRTYTSMYMTGDTGPSDSFFLESAYIQWGGITAGRTTSFFQFATGQTFMGVVSRDWADTTTNLFAYTAAFGNGLSATVALEDSTFTESSSTIYAGQRLPDLVANLRVDQGWGSAQLSGALHEVRPAIAANEGSLGWAIGGGVVFNLPMLSSDSNIFFQAQYADGALDYIGNIAGVADYDATVGSSNDTSSGYSLSAGIYHQATETIGLALDGSWSDIDGGGNVAGATRWAIDGSVQYSPVSGFAVGADMGYANTDTDGAGDQDDIRFGVRLQRTF